MNEWAKESILYGITISLVFYFLALKISARLRSPLLNPLVIAIVGVALWNQLLAVEYTSYQNGARFVSMLLLPSTISLAVPLYENIGLLKTHLKAILIAVGAGVLSGLGSILIMGKLFLLSRTEMASILPKSITTAIGIGVAEDLGGISAITMAAIMITGVFGNMMATTFIRWFRLKNPIAIGLAIGTSAHAVGTSKAIELGEVEAAMSGLSITIAGIMTVVAASFFMMWA